MGPVYFLTLRQVSGRWRLATLAVLALLPVIVTLLIVTEPTVSSIGEFETSVLGALLAGSIAPLVVLALAAAAFANEVEDRTLANLTLTPVPRWKIVLPKLLASITVAAPFLIASTIATAWLAYFGDVRAVLAVTAAVATAVVLYSAAFLWLGLVTTQAIGVGLLYVVLWEGLFAGFVQGIRIFSIRYHAIAMMHGIDPRRFADARHIEPLTVGIAGVVLLAGFTALTVRKLRRMDVP